MSKTKRGNRPITLQEQSKIMIRAESKENDTQITEVMNLSIGCAKMASSGKRSRMGWSHQHHG